MRRSYLMHFDPRNSGLPGNVGSTSAELKTFSPLTTCRYKIPEVVAAHYTARAKAASILDPFMCCKSSRTSCSWWVQGQWRRHQPAVLCSAVHQTHAREAMTVHVILCCPSPCCPLCFLPAAHPTSANSPTRRRNWIPNWIPVFRRGARAGTIVRASWRRRRQDHQLG